MSIASVHAAAFYREVAANRAVWGIKDSGGYPAPIDTNGSRAMPFWSSRQRAERLVNASPAYRGFEPVLIEWGVFCDRWIPGLAQDGLLVGVNWSGENAAGFDIAPHALQQNVAALLK